MNFMIFHGNPAKILLSLAILLCLPACTKSAEKAQLAKDLELLCRIQQSFVESKKLMKKASSVELAQERNQRLQAELKSSALIELIKTASTGPLSREKFEEFAKSSGFPQWTCPALDSN
jgi:hypothetical protein